MLTCVRWYVAYPLSLRHIEEMMRERGVFVDHATVHRWTSKMEIIRLVENSHLGVKRT
ncbi:MAG: IS6 family transposase, partial [Burkholderiaceae bacterium]|nr:IS6 family transposase [Burkholderiaceae bacterium]